MNNSVCTRGHRTRVNQTFSHVQKWARFGNAGTEFGGFFPLKCGAHKLPIFWCSYNDIVSDISLVAIRKKGHIDKLKKLLTERVPNIPRKFGELWPTNV